jgi:hypothetical protein
LIQLLFARQEGPSHAIERVVAGILISGFALIVVG